MNKTTKKLIIITIILVIIDLILAFKLIETRIPKDFEIITSERTNTEKELLGTHENKKIYYTDSIQISIKYKNKTYTMREILLNRKVTLNEIYNKAPYVTADYCEGNKYYYYKDFLIIACALKDEIYIVKDKDNANCSCD